MLQEVLTEVAYGRTESITENEVLLPENCLKETFTIMFEDNIDRLEETLSGEYLSLVYGSFYEPLKKMKLGTFSTLLKKSVKVNGKVVQFSTQSDIFRKIALIQQIRSLDLKEVFCYPLGPVPWSLATSAGELMKTNKATLMHELEKGSTSVDAIQRPFATIIDGCS